MVKMDALMQTLCFKRFSTRNFAYLLSKYEIYLIEQKKLSLALTF